MAPIYITLIIELVKVVAEFLKDKQSREQIVEAARKSGNARRASNGRGKGMGMPPGAVAGILAAFMALSAGCAWLDGIDWGEILPPIPDIPPAVTNDVPPVADLPVPDWQACKYASCWQGSNAQTRHMNILSPKCSDTEFRTRVAWAKARGCTVIHAFVGNQGDGEFAGSCIYGTAWDWSVDVATVKLFLERIAYIRAQGLAFVPWLLADDSSSWNKEAAKDFGRYLADLKAAGLLAQASIVVVGLELTEYYDTAIVKALVGATRAVYSGPVGTHEGSGSLKFASLADIVFYQTSPGLSVAQVRAEAKRVDALLGGKPWCYSELSRHEDRALSQAALDGGADMVGNW